MIFIPPMEIATRIMTLIDNANKELILVSPYISIDNWLKFKKCLQRAVDRGVKITIYARENATQNLETIRAFKVNLYLVKDLHAKIYLNETYAIASSQNLIQYSDDNSIDFGYRTETEEERAQLLSFINQYLIINKPIKLAVSEKPDSIVKEKMIVDSNTIFFKDFEIKKIYEAFKGKYSSVKINNEASYVYCLKLFSYADLMLREGFEIRFNHAITDFTSILKILKNLDLSNNHYNYTINLKMANNHPSSMIFIPQEVTDIQKLIYDYMFMAKIILDKTENKKSIEYSSEINQKLSREEINQMYKRFNVEFPDSNCKVKSIYLFSNNLIHFADVIIENEYKIKIEMDRIDFKSIIEILENMDFNYNYSYIKSIYQEYDSRIYFSITPKHFDDIQLLISDYIAITKDILKKTEKIIFN
jgi:hypothetical protein